MIAKEEFIEMMDKIGIEPVEDDHILFERYATTLVEWNKKVNLTAITDPEGVLFKHFADSLLPLTMFEMKENARLIDVGTGAGFPSVPMKLVRRDIRLTLLDSQEKRLNFLRHLCHGLGLDAITVHSRAEDAGRNEQYREKFDVATSRAVASMAELAEYCLPLVRVGGVLLALKGSSGREESEVAKSAISLCGGRIEEIFDYSLPTGDPRTLVVVRKVSPTPPKYPRNPAQIAKKHL